LKLKMKKIKLILPQSIWI